MYPHVCDKLVCCSNVREGGTKGRNIVQQSQMFILKAEIDTLQIFNAKLIFCAWEQRYLTGSAIQYHYRERKCHAETIVKSFVQKAHVQIAALGAETASVGGWCPAVVIIFQDKAQRKKQGYGQQNLTCKN